MATEDAKPTLKTAAQQNAAATQTGGQKKTAARRKTTARKRPPAKTASPRKPVATKPTAAPSKETPTRAASGEYTQEQRHKMIATMAYFLAEKRDFAPGKSDEDWLKSEKIVDDLLKQQGITLSG